MDRVVDLSSRKIESIFRIGLPSPKRNHFSFFFWGGGFGYWRFSVGSQRNIQRTFLGKKSICKSSLISWVINVQWIFWLHVYWWYWTFVKVKPLEIHWCPNKHTSAEIRWFKCSEHKAKCFVSRPVCACESWWKSSIFVFVLPLFGKRE